MKYLSFITIVLLMNAPLSYGQKFASQDSILKKGGRTGVSPPDVKLTSMDDLEDVKYPVHHLGYGATQYPYGHSEVTVHAQPLKISIIRLATGEQILSLSAGDTQRWKIRKAYTGISGKTTPLIEVKPIMYNITTNMVITTDRRIYNIRLKSGSQNGSEAGYDKQISFYYPKEFNFKTVGKSPRVERRKSHTIKNNSVNTAYNVYDGKHGFPWKPASVWDDGKHTYIKIPKSIPAQELPAFYVVNNVGDRQLINTSFNPKTRILTTDRIFKKGLFMYQRKKKGFLGIGSKTINKELFIIRK